MVGGSMKNRKKRNAAKSIREKGTVSLEYECPMNLLSRDIWVRIATKVASYSIKDLFNMQETCKVFLGAARSNAVYKEASMLELPIASFLYYYGRPEHSFIECCAEAGNTDAIHRQELMEYFWIARRGIGMELLSKASTEGSVEAGYLSTMLLLCDHENEEEVQRGVEMFESIRTSGKVERCMEFFANIFWKRWVDERPSDPGHAVACQSTTCTTCGTMACVNDVSRVSCVHCLEDYEVRIFLEIFRF
ncbi:hypothetical protein Ahy_B09g096194 isoform B [Arachis hypogaea]|uniref:At2g35280-like TPR domain-containing protein n=1 Tax=Arachis hypogaea TaxID=3818 RepID=A0A444XJ17_ARAHY|nr:hypothetical protein Ahy_B09g096194 isoform B [Arachis hypogaea]